MDFDEEPLCYEHRDQRWNNKCHGGGMGECTEEYKMKCPAMKRLEFQLPYIVLSHDLPYDNIFLFTIFENSFYL